MDQQGVSAVDDDAFVGLQGHRQTVQATNERCPQLVGANIGLAQQRMAQRVHAGPLHRFQWQQQRREAERSLANHRHHTRRMLHEEAMHREEEES